MSMTFRPVELQVTTNFSFLQGGSHPQELALQAAALGYEAIGVLSSYLEMYADWQEPLKKGVIYYLDNGRVRGVLLWNVWEKLKDATAVLADPGPLTPEQLKGRITG